MIPLSGKPPAKVGFDNGEIKYLIFRKKVSIYGIFLEIFQHVIIARIKINRKPLFRLITDWKLRMSIKKGLEKKIDYRKLVLDAVIPIGMVFSIRNVATPVFKVITTSCDSAAALFLTPI